MADMNGLVFQRLSGDETIKSMLCEYAGQPAVFNTSVPADQMAGWGGKEQFPRLVYWFVMQADPKRASSGVLHVEVYTGKDMQKCSILEGAVRNSLANIVMKPDGGSPFCVSWNRSDQYVNNQMGVLWRDLSFDLIEYPDQRTTDPDPITGMREFLHDWIGGGVVLGRDRLDGIYEPTDDAPAFYCRMDSYKTNRTTYMLKWIDADIHIHVICPSTGGQMRWARMIADELEMRGGVMLLDDSRMVVWSADVNNRADPLVAGQVSVKTEYGIEREKFAPTLENVSTSAGA